MTRILVAGWPRVGKTFLANRLGRELGADVLHTDDLIATHDWSAASLEVSAWMEDPAPSVIEGMAVPRAIRKWLSRNAEGTPGDVLYWSAKPREELTSRQIGMGKGCDTVLNEIRDELVKRGMRIENF